VTSLRSKNIRRLSQAIGVALGIMLAVTSAMSASASSYQLISGEGSSWAYNAWYDWTAQAQNQGVTINYTPNGSSVGRKDFAQQNNATFADSEIPFTGDASDPQDNTAPNFKYGMLPVVAGGTAFMYNLPVGGNQFRGLQLSMADIAGIFSGRITNWSDAALQADNPGTQLPNHPIVVVVRSDGSGATAQFKLWMLRQFPQDYALLAQHTGGNPTAASSFYPTGDYGQCSVAKPCFVAANKSEGVTAYTQSNSYTIDYDEYSYALAAHFPVAQVKNAAGFYTLPTAPAVAVALIKAGINTNPADPNYLSQDLTNVYGYGDPRAYPMSMYSYEFMPKEPTAVTTTAKGATLAWLTTNAVCEWQREMGALGYSPLPMNLVLASLDQIKQIPGIDAATSATIASTEHGVLQGGGNPCNNPTFKPGDDPAHNLLVDTAPFPASCNAACQAPWKLAGVGVAASGPHQQVSGGGAKSAPVGTTSTSAATAPPSQKCDPDTGVCTSDTASLASANVKAVPTVIGGTQGWAGPQTLGIIVGALTAFLLLAPPILNRILARSRKTRKRST
jgi:phosphate transport system substrate-binding protein